VRYAPLLLVFCGSGGGARLRWIRRFLPRARQHHARLNSVDHNLVDLFPPLMAQPARRCSSSSSCRRAALYPRWLEDRGVAFADRPVVAEIAGRSAGAARDFALSHRGIGLPAQHPGMFAALAVLVARGHVIFFALSLRSHLMLRRCTKSAIAREV